MEEPMTDLATALADNSTLSPYQGKEVLRTSIAIKGAGDGLSEAMGIDPQELAIGSRGVLVLEFVVEAHKHKPIKDTNALSLEQILKAGTATLIDSDVVQAALAAQREKIDKAKADASGQPRLVDTSGVLNPDAVAPSTEPANPDEDPPDEVLLRHHAAGQHKELTDGCPACDNERAAIAKEQDEVAAKRAAKGTAKTK
jgi:hypothetical protein